MDAERKEACNVRGELPDDATAALKKVLQGPMQLHMRAIKEHLAAHPIWAALKREDGLMSMLNIFFTHQELEVLATSVQVTAPCLPFSHNTLCCCQVYLAIGTYKAKAGCEQGGQTRRVMERLGSSRSGPSFLLICYKQ
jgi:hypothetical protein